MTARMTLRGFRIILRGIEIQNSHADCYSSLVLATARRNLLPLLYTPYSGSSDKLPSRNGDFLLISRFSVCDNQTY